MSSTCNFVVYVADENDHTPVFSFPRYSGEVEEEAEEGTPVLQVSRIPLGSWFLFNSAQREIVSEFF